MGEVPQSRVLVVDDRPENLLAISAVLEPLGKEVVTASSGAEALRRLLKEDFAVVLLDVEMPEMDGIETAELIRARPRHTHLPIIFITAERRDLRRVLRGYALGASDYLTKPLEPEILCAKVGFFVELHERGELILRQARELDERRRTEEEARRATVLEKQLVGIVGHDIRTPLSAILATAQVQLRRQELPAEQRRAFERIERSTQRIRQITDLLLDFTRAHVGRGIPLEKSPTCLVEIARRIVDETAAVHPQRTVTLRCDGERLVGLWDGARLAQVVANLLDNAVKYSPPEAPVQVSVRSSGTIAVLEVHNEGDPIPPQRLAELFDPYVRGESADAHARASLGLGLFIVRQIVRGHGGEIDVASNDGGTTFRVTLRCEPRPELLVQPPPQLLEAPKCTV